MSDSTKFVQNSPSTLAGSGAVLGATTVVLSSFYQLDGSTILTQTDFGTYGFGTIEPGNSTQEEQIAWTGITSNANGTVTLTGVTTVLTVSPYTKTSGLAKSHPGGATFIVTNTAGFYDQLTAKDDDETITGLYTFTQFPQKSGVTTPTASNELSTKAYVDSVVGGIAVTDQVIFSSTAGESITIGALVYLKQDGRWYNCDSDDKNTIHGKIIGFAQSTKTAGLAVNIVVAGLDKNQTGLSIGSIYYAGTTPGTITKTAPTTVWAIGVARTATSIITQEGFTVLPTANEKAALVGTSGTAIPSATNKFVDANDVSAAAVSGKVVRATGTALPALSGINLISTNLAGAFISGQVQGDLLLKTSGVGWSRLAVGTAGTVPVATTVNPGIVYQPAVRWAFISQVSTTAIAGMTTANVTIPSGATAAIVRMFADRNEGPDLEFGGEVTIFPTGKTTGVIREVDASSSKSVTATWGAKIAITTDATNVCQLGNCNVTFYK